MGRGFELSWADAPPLQPAIALPLWMLQRGLELPPDPSAPLGHFVVFQPSPAPSAAAAPGPIAGVAGWGLCRTGGTSLGQTFEGNGAVFLSWVKCFGSDSFECLPARAQCGELGGRATCSRARTGPGSWKGQLCSNIFIYLVCPCP